MVQRSRTLLFTGMLLELAAVAVLVVCVGLASSSARERGDAVPGPVALLLLVVFLAGLALSVLLLPVASAVLVVRRLRRPVAHFWRDLGQLLGLGLGVLCLAYVGLGYFVV